MGQVSSQIKMLNLNVSHEQQKDWHLLLFRIIIVTKLLSSTMFYKIITIERSLSLVAQFKCFCLRVWKRDYDVTLGFCPYMVALISAQRLAYLQAL